MSKSHGSRWKPLLGTLAVLLIVFLAWKTIASIRTEDEVKQQARREMQRIQQSVDKLVSDHNAIASGKWGSKLPVLGKVFSAQLSQALLRDDGQPLLFIVLVEDVAIEGDKYTCTVYQNLDPKPSLSSLRLVLDCGAEQATQLMNGSGAYAVVARIDSVERRVVDEGVAASIGGIRPIFRHFVAKGKCVAILPVGENYDDDFPS